MVDVGDIPPTTSRRKSKISVDEVDSATDKDGDISGPGHYKMNNRNRGFFLIFNHYEYEKKLELNVREGTKADVSMLRKSWERLGFQVKVFDDYTSAQIQEKIKKYCKKDHKDNDCFGCAVLTHGGEGDVLYAYDGEYKVSNLTEPFCHCESLLGKPKLFFIQACRGTKHDDGKTIRQKAFDQTDAGVDPDESFSCDIQEIVIPTESDILIVYSTGPGYFAWRSHKGSWFIDMLTKCLDKFATELELIQILTAVNKQVGRRKSETDLEKYRGKKQMPAIVSRLTALLFFSMPSDTSKLSVHKSVSFSETDLSNKAPLCSRQSTASSVGVFFTQGTEDCRDLYYRKKLEAVEKKRELLDLKEEIWKMKLESPRKVLFD